MEITHESSSRTLYKEGSKGLSRSENSRIVQQSPTVESLLTTEEEVGGGGWGLSVQMVIALLCMGGIVISSTAATGLVVTSCDSALQDTRQGGDESTERCFGTSNANLQRVVGDLLTYSSSGVERLVNTYLHSMQIESIRMGKLITETYGTTNKTLPEFMSVITAYEWAALASLRGAGISGVGWHGDGRASSLSYDGDTNGMATFYCEEGKKCQAGYAAQGTGMPIPSLTIQLPIYLDELATVKFFRSEPSLWNATEGTVRWTGMDSVSSFLGYSLTAVAIDPAGSIKQLSWIVTMELNYIQDYLISLGKQIREQTKSKTRIFTVVASSWIADKKKALGSFDWQQYDQTRYLTGVSNGDACLPYTALDPLFNGTATLYRPLKDVNATDAIIAGLAVAIDGRYQGLSQYRNLSLPVTYNGSTEDFFVDIRRVNDGLGIDWWLVSAIDAAYVLSDVIKAETQTRLHNEEAVNHVESKINKERATTYIILAFVAIGTLALSAYTAHMVLQPIKTIQQEMTYVARMELERSTVTPTSTLKEVRRMQRDFTKMITNLREYRAYVPAALLTDAARGCTQVVPPTGTVSIMFTDIQGSTGLWKKSSIGMDTAMETHNDSIREAYMQNRGYEVKTIGDAFMIAFDNPRNAVATALEIQVSLQEQQWPQDLELDEDGLLVRIGLHVGQPIVETNPLTNRMDYRGSVVNMACRVEGKAKGGTTCMTKDFYNAIKADLASINNPVVVDYGIHDLRGLGDGHALYLVAPSSQRARLNGPGRSSFTTIIVSNPGSDGEQSLGVPDTRHTETRSGGSAMPPTKIEPKSGTGNIQQHVQQKTGLALGSNFMTVAVCKLIVKDKERLFESYNFMVRAATEAAYATDGVVGDVHGKSMTIIWNGTKKCPLHVTSALRFAAQLETRAGQLVKIGIATGRLYHGNVGTQKKRFATTFGYPLEAAEAVVDHNVHLDTFCLLCDCTSDDRIANDPSVSSFVRLLDSWYETTENRKILIYELQAAKLTDQLESWGNVAVTIDKDTEMLANALKRIWSGDPSPLADIRRQMLLSSDDAVLRNVVTMLENSAPHIAEGCRAQVSFSHVPMGAELWTKHRVETTEVQCF